MAEGNKYRFGCPHCKSEHVRENNIVHVRLAVLAWDEDGEPDNFGEQTTVDDTIRTVYENEAERYYCADCGKEFNCPISLDEEPATR